jgi:RNA polymerase subunit RPABC4/transcription elongation factor Spt4
MISDASLSHANEEHYCPYCNSRLSFCRTPSFNVGDGLGWGTDAFFLCLNDDCSMFVGGWKHIEEEYQKTSSYRYMQLPGEENGMPMMVGSRMAFTDSVIDVEEEQKPNVRYQREQKARQELKTCVADKNIDPVVYLITDEEANLEARKKACELLEELNDFSCIDPIRNHKFRHTEIGQVANLAVSRMLKNNFKRECPSCAEIIKLQAKICQHCHKELA